MLHLDYLPDWPLSGPGEERRTVVVSLTQDCCALTCLAGGGRLRLVDGRHRTSKLTCLTVSRQLLTVFLGTGNSPALLVLPVSLSFLHNLEQLTLLTLQWGIHGGETKKPFSKR